MVFAKVAANQVRHLPYVRRTVQRCADETSIARARLPMSKTVFAGVSASK